MAAGFSSVQRDRFLSSRILLRLHAARLAGVTRGSLRADYYCPTCTTQGNKVHGIPRYKVPRQGSGIRLSLSRAEDWCLLAGSAESNIIRLGIDVQEMSSTDFDGFGTVALTSVERDLAWRMAPSMRLAFMAQLWVRKEAVLKALGCGLMMEPSTVDVSGRAPVIRGQAMTPEDWLITDVHPAAVGLPGKYVAALALLRAPTSNGVIKRGSKPQDSPKVHITQSSTGPNGPHTGRPPCTN
ncbi:4'-phosphopantetheinyl transferase family protein [Arthrobacter sp. CAN_A214]|uniref:4'-phosphopantetheinyl transferase family protein n=1 Tax=Arthrobacter sp. CAN_A214 TaxID=2787720 RepID=UPI003FA4746A